MEFTIDFDLVRNITGDEYRQARADIAASGPLPALQRSQQRHDQRLSAANDAPTLACKAGCHWCCYFSVDARAVEVFNIIEFVARNLDAQQQARVRREIEANSAALEPLNDVERMQHNLKCPFLDTGRCIIYAARPQTCRNYHATDARGCQQSFEEPHNLDIEPQYAPLVFQAGASHVDAFATAMHEAGYDTQAYELSTALLAAMNDPDARQRFENKQPPFPTIEGTEVPSEWMDE